MVRRTSGVSRFNIYKFSEVLGLIGMVKIVSKTGHFRTHALLYFQLINQSIEFISRYVNFNVRLRTNIFIRSAVIYFRLFCDGGACLTNMFLTES